MKKVAAYCRVSTEIQEKKNTIDIQRAAIEEWAQNNDAVIVEWYKDDGWSGELLARPELDRLRDDADKNVWDAVVFVDRDRLARLLYLQELIIYELKEKNQEVICIKQPIGETPEERALQQVLGVFAELDRLRITEKLRRGKLHKAQLGKLVGHNPPYGYRYIPKIGENECHFEIYEPEAQIVRMIFSWVVDKGYSIRKVVKELYLKEIPPAKGKSDRWVKSVVERLLKRTDYYGVSYFNKSISVVPKNPINKSEYKRVKKTSRREKPRNDWYPIKVPAIIGKDLFDRTQERLQVNKVLNPRNKIYNYILTGKVSCACGAKRVGDGVNGHHYYRCAARIYKYPVPTKCEYEGVNAVILDNSVWNKMYTLVTQPDLLKPFIDQYNKNQLDVQKTKERLDRPRKALAILEEEEKRYVKAYGAKLIEFNQFQECMKEIKAKKVLIKAELDSFEDKAIDQIVNIDKEKVASQDVLFGMKYFDTTEKQELMRKLVTSVIVGERSVALVKGVIPVVTDAQNIQGVLKSRNSWVTKCWKIYTF